MRTKCWRVLGYAESQIDACSSTLACHYMHDEPVPDGAVAVYPPESGIVDGAMESS